MDKDSFSENEYSKHDYNNMHNQNRSNNHQSFHNPHDNGNPVTFTNESTNNFTTGSTTGFTNGHNNINQTNMNRKFDALSETVSFKEWLFTLILLHIPIVNLILAIVLGFFGNVKESQRNFYRAYAIKLLLVLLFYIIIGIIIVYILFSIASMPNMYAI